MEREPNIKLKLEKDIYIPIEDNIPFKEIPVLFDINFFDKILVFDSKNKPKKNDDLPENFSEIISELTYRGSWPLDIIPLSKKCISRIITLYSSDDKSETEDLVKLRQQINKTKIDHCIFDMVDNQTYWQAAEEILKTNQITYVHCRGGSIRTGIVCLLTELLYMKKMNLPCDDEMFFKLVSKTIKHGFNYNNNGYRLLFEDVINESYRRNLLSKNPLST